VALTPNSEFGLRPRISVYIMCMPPLTEMLAPVM
jgi:hypothetical protein